MLSLQRTAGNAAVSRAIRGPAGPAATPAVLQRQPKTKKPKWITDAQAELAKLFPNDPLMKNVVIKDYAGLNKTLQTIHYGAWTQSKTEIYLRNPAGTSKKAPPIAQQAMFVQYVLHHEAVHIGQFDKAGGPPQTWQQMLEFERDAYSADRVWLAGAGAQLITDPDVLDLVDESSDKNLIKCQSLLDSTKGLSGKAREAALFKGMIGKDLIPAKSDPDPLKLYRQP